MDCSVSKKHILQIFATLNVGGAESRMMDVYRNIDRNKCEFHFLSMSEDKQYFESEILALGGKIIKIPAPRESGLINNFFSIYEIIKNGQYDAVHAHTSFHCGVVMLAAFLAGVPVRISHSRTTGSKHNSLKNKIALVVGRALVSLFSTVRLAISPEAGEFLFGKKFFSVMPNAIDVEKYVNTDIDCVEKLKNVYNIEKDCICIGMVGRFDSMKNHKFAVEIFNEYFKVNNKSKLILVGDGVLKKDIEKKVKSYSLEKAVIFTGLQSNINEWMQLFDILLVPSHFEGLGGVILEAQAAGTPVIKSNTFTDEADMNLGLVKSLPIDNGTDEWIGAIKNFTEIKDISSAKILSAFSKRGYSLKDEVKTLQKIYGVK